MEIWQLERIKDKVEELEGRLEVRIFALDGTIYKIWYYPRDDVALYGKLVLDEEKRRERSEKAWPRTLLEAMKHRDTKVQVRIRNNGRTEKWFGSEPDMSPLDEVYRYVVELR
ncbi:MAG: hypothetical protein ABSF82_14585 [Candidatus Bathyarchaeia archaeon]